MYAFASNEVEKKFDNIEIHIKKNIYKNNTESITISAVEINNNHNIDIAYVTISLNSSSLAVYSKNTFQGKWFGKRTFMQKRVFNVLTLNSKRKGYGSLILAYGLLYMKCRYPDIDYSVLDDESAQETQIKNNIYNKFGYTPTFQATPINNNTAVVTDGKKQVYLPDFLEKTIRIFNIKIPGKTLGKSGKSNKNSLKTALKTMRTHTKSNSTRSRSQRK